MKYYLDTNIFVRLLSASDEKSFGECVSLFEKIENGTTKAHILSEIIPEIVYVMTSPKIGYEMDRNELANRLIYLLGMECLYLENKQSILSSLQIYRKTKLDYVDCLHIAIVENSDSTIVSFDKEYKKYTSKCKTPNQTQLLVHRYHSPSSTKTP